MDILREHHYYYSVYSREEDQTDINFNLFSRKSAPVALHKIQTFDKIIFSKVEDHIRFFLICSCVKNWYIAVFHRRVL